MASMICLYTSLMDSWTSINCPHISIMGLAPSITDGHGKYAHKKLQLRRSVAHPLRNADE